MGTRLGSRRLWIYGLLLTAVAATPLHAAQIVWVDAAGTCQGNTPCFTTIQQGVNNASAPPSQQAEVRVYPGTYNESVNLFLIGSAVGGVQVDVLIVNTDFLSLATGIATSPAVSNGPPPALPAEIVDQLERARQRIPRSAAAAPAASASEGAASGVALLPVNVNAPAGPAFYGSNLSVDVIIVGMTVHSPDAAGVDIISEGNLEFNFGTANSNFGSGVVLESVGADVGAVFSTFNDNGGAGADFTASDSSGEIFVANCIADGNTLNGFTFVAGSTVQAFSLPLVNDPLFAGVPQHFAARMNMQNGISAVSLNEGVTIVDFLILAGPILNPTFILDDNTLNGLVADGDEGVTVAGVRANGNDFNGMLLSSNGSVTVLSVIASGNVAQGVHVTESSVFLAIVVTAKGNRNGIAATSNDASGDQDGTPSFGALLIATTTDDNMLNGTLITATGGPIFIFSSTAISNGVSGMQIQPPIGSANRVNGGIICENTIGFVLDTNANVDAEGNWWGTVSGPQHAVRNPGGTGNPVHDATNGGSAGFVDFSPWIDTITAQIHGPLHFGSPTPISFQFSGGNGAVFLGPPQDFPLSAIFGLFQLLGPGAVPPFTVSSADGNINSLLESGPSALTFLTAPMGIAAVDFVPLKIGPVSATITGPCGLTATVTGDAGGAQAAPILSVGGLLAAFATLLAIAAFALRRAGSRSSRGVT